MHWAMAAALAAGALAVSSAYAAGPMATPAVYTWTSCYIGGNAGVGWDQTDVVDEIDGSPITSLSSTALVGGGQVGCDDQISPHWVIGAQGMWDATGLSASVTPGSLEGLTLHGTVPWFATFTGRIGYLPAPSWMIYAKGGLAWNRTNAALLDGSDVYDSISFGQSGWTAGIGAEWKYGPRWSSFAEYDYMGFSPTTPSFPISGDIGTVKQNIQAVVFGVNFHLN